jgi:threonylcarbamoyladenosine tRNA methylthiotransferase MtaB
MRIRLSSVEPTEVNDQLLEILTRFDNFMPHLHIPLQSGDDRILSRMNRHYTAETFVEGIKKINAVLPHAAIGCDVLAGFPSEDEKTAENTFRLLAGLPITYLHVFPYSIRPGTLAASMKKQIPGKIKDGWVKRLRQLDQDKRQEFYQRHIGSHNQVLVERRNKKTGLLQGFSENYIPLQFEGPTKLCRRVVPVYFERMEGELPMGVIEMNQE